MEHAIRNASRQDVERIAHAAVDAAKEWLEKPAYEKGESLGRATTAIASEVAIDVLTDGIGSVATLRKVGKVADAADHVRDAEKVVSRVTEAVHAHPPELPTLNRRTAYREAKERAGIPSSQSPEKQWTVGNDTGRAGQQNYRLSQDPASHGRFYEFETPQGTRVVVEHTNDPRAPAAHFHAGQPKGDPTRQGVDFKTERYQPVDGKHHIYYKK